MSGNEIWCDCGRTIRAPQTGAVRCPQCGKVHYQQARPLQNPHASVRPATQTSGRPGTQSAGSDDQDNTGNNTIILIAAGAGVAVLLVVAFTGLWLYTRSIDSNQSPNKYMQQKLSELDAAIKDPEVANRLEEDSEEPIWQSKLTEGRKLDPPAIDPGGKFAPGPFPPQPVHHQFHSLINAEHPAVLMHRNTHYVLVSLKDGEQLHTFDIEPDERFVSISPDGRMIATRFPRARRLVIRSLGSESEDELVLEGRESSGLAMFAGDSKLLTFADESVKAWSLPSMEKVYERKLLGFLSYSPGRNQYLETIKDRVYFTNVNTGEAAGIVKDEGYTFHFAQLSSDGKQLAAFVSWKGEDQLDPESSSFLNVYDVQSGTRTHRIPLFPQIDAFGSPSLNADLKRAPHGSELQWLDDDTVRLRESLISLSQGAVVHRDFYQTLQTVPYTPHAWQLQERPGVLTYVSKRLLEGAQGGRPMIEPVLTNGEPIEVSWNLEASPPSADFRESVAATIDKAITRMNRKTGPGGATLEVTVGDRAESGYFLIELRQDSQTLLGKDTRKPFRIPRKTLWIKLELQYRDQTLWSKMVDMGTQTAAAKPLAEGIEFRGGFDNDMIYKERWPRLAEKLEGLNFPSEYWLYSDDEIPQTKINVDLEELAQRNPNANLLERSIVTLVSQPPRAPRVWDVESTQESPSNRDITFPISLGDQTVRSFRFSPPSLGQLAYLQSSGGDGGGNLVTMDLKTGDIVSERPMLPRFRITGFYDEGVVTDEPESYSQSKKPHSIDGKYFFDTRDKRPVIVKRSDGTIAGELECPPGATTFYTAAFHPEAPLLAAIAGDRCLVWNLSDGKLKQAFTCRCDVSLKWTSQTELLCESQARNGQTSKVLYNVTVGVPIWGVEGLPAITTTQLVNNRVCMVTQDDSQESRLVQVPIPGDAVKKHVRRMLQLPSVKPPKNVSLSISYEGKGDPNEAESRIRPAVKKALGRRGVAVDEKPGLVVTLTLSDNERDTLANYVHDGKEYFTPMREIKAELALGNIGASHGVRWAKRVVTATTQDVVNHVDHDAQDLHQEHYLKLLDLIAEQFENMYLDVWRVRDPVDANRSLGFGVSVFENGIETVKPYSSAGQ